MTLPISPLICSNLMLTVHISLFIHISNFCFCVIIMYYNPSNLFAPTRLAHGHHVTEYSPKTGKYPRLVYTTEVNSTFCARWLANLEVISQVLFTSEQPGENKMAFVGKLPFGPLVIQLRAASYSACVIYTKTIIHLSVGESGGYLPCRGGSANIHHYSPPLRWIILLNIPQFSKLCASRKRFEG